MRPPIGLRGEVETTLPIGAGLSSSAALLVALALAFGYDGSDVELALMCQRAEARASGVPVGVMDPLVSACGRATHALLIDCHTLEFARVPLPDSVRFAAVHSGQPRTLAGSAYGVRRAEVAAAATALGSPLREASPQDVRCIDDPVLRRRARHVVSENERTRLFAAAMAARDLAAVGELMEQSQASLRDDYEVSTPTVDALVEQLRAWPGVIGARMTGGGFGGAVVVAAHADSALPGWEMIPSDGALALRREATECPGASASSRGPTAS